MRDRIQTAAVEFVERGSRRRAAARVERAYSGGRRIVHEREEIAADSIHGGLDDREYGRRRDRCVHSVAALLEYAETGRRCKRLTRGGEAVARHHDRSRGPGIVRWSVAWRLPGTRRHRAS